MKYWRHLLLLAGLVLVLGAGNLTILEKQRTLDEGRRILLELRPVDPRSLMQGDYMVLAYAEKVFPDQAATADWPLRGRVVLSLDDRGIGSFARFDDGSALSENELRLGYKLITRWGTLRYGAESFFFQEGDRALYGGARFGVLAVDGAGNSVLVGLADEDGSPIVK